MTPDNFFQQFCCEGCKGNKWWLQGMWGHGDDGRYWSMWEYSSREGENDASGEERRTKGALSGGVGPRWEQTHFIHRGIKAGWWVTDAGTLADSVEGNGVVLTNCFQWCMSCSAREMSLKTYLRLPLHYEVRAPSYSRRIVSLSSGLCILAHVTILMSRFASQETL